MLKGIKTALYSPEQAALNAAAKGKKSEAKANQAEAEPVAEPDVEAEVESVDGGESDAGQGEFGDGITKPLYEFTASRFRGGRVFTPNVIRVWSDRIEEYEHHAVLKKGTQAINFHLVAQVKLAKGLRWSDVSVESTGGHIITLRGVPKSDGDRIKALIDNAVNEARRGNAAPVVVAAPVDGPAEQLKKLAELHQSGLLTDEEFAAKRAVIVEKL